MAGGGPSRSQEAVQVCCHFNTGPGVLGTGKQKDRNVEADNSSGRVYATCMYQTVFGQSCISPVGARFTTWGRVVARAVLRTGMWILGAYSARSRHTTRGPVREAPPGLDPVNERSEEGCLFEEGNGAG